MCGRYYVDDGTIGEIERIVGQVNARLREISHGDVFPSQAAMVLTGRREALAAEEMRWGFPQYKKKGLLINARAETVLERRTFRDSVLHRRCVIPAGHFYEWDQEKNKVTFSSEDTPVLYMAGFYQRFQEEDHFIIMTTQANPSVSGVHHRMPLILEREELDTWVYEDSFLNYALKKVPSQLKRYQTYEQQNLFEYFKG